MRALVFRLAMESMLVHRDVAGRFLPDFLGRAFEDGRFQTWKLRCFRLIAREGFPLWVGGRTSGRVLQ